MLDCRQEPPTGGQTEFSLVVQTLVPLRLVVCVVVCVVVDDVFVSNQPKCRPERKTEKLVSPDESSQ